MLLDGSIRCEGHELLGRPEKELARVRGGTIAYIPQDPLSSLNPAFTIGWQIAEAIWTRGTHSKQEANVRAVELLEVVGIPRAAEQAGRYPHEFSGGMRQRVVIAMAMANNPDVLLADEPTTALDVTIQAQVLEALKAARDQTNASVILITHDLGVVAGMADRVMVMYGGTAVETADADEIFYRSRMPYTLGLLGFAAAAGLPVAGAAAPDSRLAAVADRPAQLVSVRAALPDGDRPLPGGRTRSARGHARAPGRLPPLR